MFFFQQASASPTLHYLRTPNHCFRRVDKCVPLVTSQCLDVTLPYKFTSLTTWISNSSSSNSQSVDTFVDPLFEHFEQTQFYLSQWKSLRAIPHCWKALQSVLCASFFPRCDNESSSATSVPSSANTTAKRSRILLPNYDMCRLTRGPCRLLDKYYEWPDFLKCHNDTLFPAKCPNEYTDLKFNMSHASNQLGTTSPSGKCMDPLVSTDDANVW